MKRTVAPPGARHEPKNFGPVAQHNSLKMSITMQQHIMSSIQTIVETLRSHQASGLLNPIPFRIAQLRKLNELLVNEEPLILEALHRDMKKVLLKIIMVAASRGVYYRVVGCEERYCVDNREYTSTITPNQATQTNGCQNIYC
jgi:hypothetical protein